MPRSYLIPVFFIIFLGLALSFGTWGPWFFGELTGDTGTFIQSLQNLLQIVFWLIAGTFGAWAFFKGIKNNNSSQSVESAQPQHSPQILEKAYLKQLDSQCEVLRLDLISKSMQERGVKLSLSHIYQDQHIRLAEKKAEDNKQDLEKSEPLPLMQALEKLQNNHLVIRGGVGTGKSSFINFLSHSIIQTHLEDNDTDLPKRFIAKPIVRLLLRKTGSQLEQGSKSQGLLLRAIKTEMQELISHYFEATDTPINDLQDNAPFIENYLDGLKEKGILLLDGLDEVAESEGRRDLLNQAIEDFADKHPNVLIIVTGRPYAYERQDQKLSGFQQADLEPMTQAQIYAFISQWYKVARHANSWSKQQAQDSADQLTIEIFNRSYLADMAHTAMLLTLFIGLDFSGYRLPSSRAKLYEEAIELLLQRWHKNLQQYRHALDPADQEGFMVLERSPDELLKALETLAYSSYIKLSPKQGGDNSDEVLLEFDSTSIIGHLYKAFGQSVDSDHLQYFLQYRSALLVAGSDEDNFQFAHKSFHEYMAASHLMRSPSWKQKIEDLLKENQDWWREVFLLMIKKYADDYLGEAVQLLKHLSRFAEKEPNKPEHQRLMMLISEAALELDLPTVAKKQNDEVLYTSFYAFLQDALVNTLTGKALEVSERASAGRLLSDIGDPREGINTISDKEGNKLPDICWEKVPAGELLMGFSEEQIKNDWDKPSIPQHSVAVSPFNISRYPVTNAQYACFIVAGGYKNKDYWQLPEALAWLEGKPADLSLLDDNKELQENYKIWLEADTARDKPRFWHEKKWNRPNHPVVGLCWYEALAFCHWLNSTDEYQDKPVRLPTEAEWEYAARGTQGLNYACGNEINKALANYKDTGLERTSAVGVFPVAEAFAEQGVQLYDLTGNVWEWTQSQWGKQSKEPDFTYEKWADQEGERNNPQTHALRITRGGSWFDSTGYARCAFRYRLLPYVRDYFIGFRVVRE